MFKDRRDAGRRLGVCLGHLHGKDVVVLGLPRGGVPVAYEVARALEAPLDVIMVRKLGVPFQPELAMGAIGEGDVKVLNHDIVSRARVTLDEVGEVEARERRTLEERGARFRAGRPRVSVEGRTVVVVDDGIATGSTAHAACQVARAAGAARVVLATPVAPHDSDVERWPGVDEFVCPYRPTAFYAIGQFYEDFGQTADAEVVGLLDRAAKAQRRRTQPRASLDEDVTVEVDGLRLPGHLDVPTGAAGVVLFAHGSGSSRHSPRNQYVASVLHTSGIGTLLFDLLTSTEEHDRSLVFDVEMLAARLAAATAWLGEQPVARGLPVGYFGASTGAAAALLAAAAPGAAVDAVVSRGGRPDLASAGLARVTAPTLLIVGGRDELVLELNRRARDQLRCPNRLAVVPDATHLFEEPGTLGNVARLAADWFVSHLGHRVTGAAS